MSKVQYLTADRAVEAMAALAHDHRLAIYRLLVQAGPAGRAAGELAHALAIAPSSLSFHISHLSRAGLVSATRRGRSIRYRTEYRAMRAMVAYLTENCCGGSACDADGETSA